MADRLPRWDAILARAAAWATLVVASEAAIDDFARTLPAGSGATVRVVRGHRCVTKRALMHEWAAALQFPGYFGENWDAFEECLADRDGLTGEFLVVILTSVDRVLEDEKAERATFLRVLKGAAAGAGGHPLRVLFQCDAGHEGEARAILQAEGIRA